MPLEKGNHFQSFYCQIAHVEVVENLESKLNKGITVSISSFF